MIGFRVHLGLHLRSSPFAGIRIVISYRRKNQKFHRYFRANRVHLTEVMPGNVYCLCPPHGWPSLPSHCFDDSSPGIQSKVRGRLPSKGSCEEGDITEQNASLVTKGKNLPLNTCLVCLTDCLSFFASSADYKFSIGKKRRRTRV